MASRAVRTPFGHWWRTVDRATLAALFGLMLGGIILSLAAAAGDAGQYGGAVAAAVGRGAAGDAAGLRPDHADRAGLGRAVLHGRDAADLGRRACGSRRLRPHWRLFHRAACGAAHPALH